MSPPWVLTEGTLARTPGRDGRWPANVLHDGSEEVEDAFEAFGELRARGNKTAKIQARADSIVQYASRTRIEKGDSGDSGTASRFFYCAKESKDDQGGSRYLTAKPIALVGCARYVFNRGLALREERYANGERTNYSFLAKELVSWKQDKETEWLKEVSSTCLQQALMDLDRAYKNFFEKRARHPKPRKKHKGAQSARFPMNAFAYADGVLRVAKMDEPLNVIWHRPLPGEPTSMTVILEPTGEWFVSFVVKFDVEEDPKSEKNHSIGLDLGLDSFCVLSTGEKIENPRHYRKNQRRLKKLQRRLARKKKGEPGEGPEKGCEGACSHQTDASGLPS